MVKKYLLFVKKKWETIEICPHPPPTDPYPGKAERSGRTQWQNGVEKQKIEGDSVHRSRRGIKSFLFFFQFAQRLTEVVQTTKYLVFGSYYCLENFNSGGCSGIDTS